MGVMSRGHERHSEKPRPIAGYGGMYRMAGDRSWSWAGLGPRPYFAFEGCEQSPYWPPADLGDRPALADQPTPGVAVGPEPSGHRHEGAAAKLDAPPEWFEVTRWEASQEVPGHRHLRVDRGILSCASCKASRPLCRWKTFIPEHAACGLVRSDRSEQPTLF